MAISWVLHGAFNGDSSKWPCCSLLKDLSIAIQPIQQGTGTSDNLIFKLLSICKRDNPGMKGLAHLCCLVDVSGSTIYTWFKDELD